MTAPSSPTPLPHRRHHISLAEATRVWALVAAQSFGGPAGQIAVMHRLVVEERRWISEERFLHALNYCMLLPGPEAQQLATYIGWLLHGKRGGLIAGGLFVLPGFLSILALSVLYALFQQTSAMQALFFGLRAAVLVIVLDALWRMSQRVLKQPILWWIAAGAFVALFLFGVPFPVVIVAAGVLGYLGLPRLGQSGPQNAPSLQQTDEGYVITAQTAPQVRPTWQRALQVGTVGLLTWFVPLLAVGAWAGFGSVYWQQAKFFSQMAVVTFGGAYAVLAYVAQRAVEVYGWLTPQEMLSGLAMAETTPGPLIQVVQYVGFLGAYRAPELLSPLLGGVLASLVVTWATFAPCFLWIFLGAPYIEQLRGNKALAGALTAITAAVVGVILNLSVWFALHTLFGQLSDLQFGPLRLSWPHWATLDWLTLLLALGAGVALFRWRWSSLQVLGACCLLGAVLWGLRGILA